MVAKPAHVESADDAAVARPVETAVIQQQTAAALTTPESTVAYQQMQGTTNTEGWLNNNLSLVDDKTGKSKPTDSTTHTLSSTDPSETPEPPPPEYAVKQNEGRVFLASDDTYPSETPEPDPPQNA